MKRGILIATLLVAVAGVASANLLTAAPRSEASSAKVKIAAAEPVATSAPVAQAQAPAPAAKPAPTPSIQKASVETRQAPVPLKVMPRPPVNLPLVDASAEPGKAATTDQPAAADDVFNDKAAKAAIEADGYRGVRVLNKGPNGIWQAKALRGSVEVTLTVDASGSVSAN